MHRRLPWFLTPVPKRALNVLSLLHVQKYCLKCHIPVSTNLHTPPIHHTPLLTPAIAPSQFRTFSPFIPASFPPHFLSTYDHPMREQRRRARWVPAQPTHVCTSTSYPRVYQHKLARQGRRGILAQQQRQLVSQDLQIRVRPACAFHFEVQRQALSCFGVLPGEVVQQGELQQGFAAPRGQPTVRVLFSNPIDCCNHPPSGHGTRASLTCTPSHCRFGADSTVQLRLIGFIVQLPGSTVVQRKFCPLPLLGRKRYAQPTRVRVSSSFISLISLNHVVTTLSLFNYTSPTNAKVTPTDGVDSA